MKKLTLVLAAVLLSGIAAMASAVNADLLTGAKYQLTPEGMAKMQSAAQRQKMGVLQPGEQMMTRSYVDRSGKIWDFSVLLTVERICDLVSFEDDNGNPVTYGFDVLPYYACNMILSARNSGADLDTYVTFMACWPAYYIYEQIFTYTGELDSKGHIPEALRDYEAVSMTRLATDPDFTQKFKESKSVGEKPIEGTTKFPYWTILENAMDSAGGQCLINGDTCQTLVTDTYGSTLEFLDYDNETSDIDCKITLYYSNLNTSNTSNLRVQYTGTARVEGFEETEEKLPEFGDIHVFNAGLWDSTLFGDENPFTGAWGPYTALYIAAGDKNLKWMIDDTAGGFNTEAIDRVVDVDPSELDNYANSIEGYLFADPKYGRDTNMDPVDGNLYKCLYPLTGTDSEGFDYIEIVPTLNTFVPRGYSNESWSDVYGLLAYVHNFPEMLNEGSRLGWGTPDGFRAELKNMYKKTIYVASKGDIIYHYNAANMADVRTFSSIGTTEWGSGVQGVMVSSSIVSAANGVISVKAGVATDVMVFSLDGVCIANRSAASGETLEIAAPKGIYAVVVEGKTTKVVL